MSDKNNKESEKRKPEYKFIDLTEFKSIDEGNGSFSGYANNFGILDSYDDITLPGCFSESLKEFEDAGFGAADHRWGISTEIGIVNKAYEDAVGLFVEVGYHPTDDAQAVRQKINNRLANGKKCSLSIGYRCTEREYVVGEEAAPFLINPSQEVLNYLKEVQPLVRLIKKAKLYEASAVSAGANAASQIEEAKSQKRLLNEEELRRIGRTHTPTPKQIEILNLKYRSIDL